MSELSKASKEYVEHAPKYNDEITWQIQSAYEAGAYWRMRSTPDHDSQVDEVRKILCAWIFPPLQDDDRYNALARTIVDCLRLGRVTADE